MQRAQMIRVAQIERIDKPNPKISRDLGMGYFNLAALHQQQGELSLAESNALQAVKVFTELQESQPEDINYNRYLAACQRVVGDLQKDFDPTAAVASYRKSQQVLEKSLKSNPNVVDLSADLAGVLLNLGDLLQSQGELDAALEAINRSISVLTKLAQEIETVPWYRLDLGRAQRQSGIVLREAQRLDEAKEKLEASRATLSELVSADLSNEEYTAELALTMDAIAGLEAAAQQPEDGDQ